MKNNSTQNILLILLIIFLSGSEMFSNRDDSQWFNSTILNESVNDTESTWLENDFYAKELTVLMFEQISNLVWMFLVLVAFLWVIFGAGISKLCYDW